VWYEGFKEFFGDIGMFTPRVIPCLLLKNDGLVKTIQFDKPRYIGDPINAVRIFNEKKVNELVFLDIMASRGSNIRGIDFDMLSRITQECMMPLTYGGGIRTLNDVNKLFKIGVEKICLNTVAFDNPSFIRECSQILGSQSVLVSIDAKKIGQDYFVFTHCGSLNTKVDVFEYSKKVEEYGAGEILINSVDKDGTMNGYDIDLIKRVSNCVSIPVIACGGAGSLNDFKEAVINGYASAVAAGSFFVFFGKKRAVLITYPELSKIQILFREVI